MHEHHSYTHLQDNSAEAIRVTWIGSIIDTLLGISKILFGWLFHSHGLIADGIHSLSDLITDFMVVAILKYSNAEPDAEHPYGHERFETLGTVVLGCLLIAVAGAMAYDSISNLLTDQEALIPAWPTLVVAAISIISKEWIFRYTRAVGERIKSDLIIANAWHSRTDAYSSLVVLIGLLGAMMGFPMLDSLAAVVVAGFVAKIGWELSWKSLQELVDTAIDPAEMSAITATAKEVEGVVDVHSFKSRQMGPKKLLEMHLQVAPYLSSSEGHYIGDCVIAKLTTKFDSIGHIIFHIDTEDDDDDPFCTLLPSRTDIRAMLEEALERHAPGQKMQRFTLHYIRGRVEIELFMSESSDLAGAQHAIRDEFAAHPWLLKINIWQPR